MTLPDLSEALQADGFLEASNNVLAPYIGRFIKHYDTPDAWCGVDIFQIGETPIVAIEIAANMPNETSIAIRRRIIAKSVSEVLAMIPPLLKILKRATSSDE